MSKIKLPWLKSVFILKQWTPSLLPSECGADYQNKTGISDQNKDLLWELRADWSGVHLSTLCTRQPPLSFQQSGFLYFLCSLKGLEDNRH